jgi:hypothetical protein
MILDIISSTFFPINEPLFGSELRDICPGSDRQSLPYGPRHPKLNTATTRGGKSFSLDVALSACIDLSSARPLDAIAAALRKHQSY